MKSSFQFRNLRFVFLLFACTWAISSCEKTGYLPEKGDNTSGRLAQTTIAGVISDESGQPVEGVLINVDGYHAVTNIYGAYVLERVLVNRVRFVVTATKPGFFASLHASLFMKKASCQYTNMVMIHRQVTATFQAAAGGTIQVTGNATIQFPPGSIADANGNTYTGTVRIYAAALNPDNPGFYKMIPGGDLRAVNSNGEERVLASYGMVNAELVGQGGQTLNLAPGAKATIRYPVATAQMASAPATIPMWYLDEKSAIWHEEGMATLNGGFYEGDVAHFTWWNCDYPGGMAQITGHVVNCTGVPVPNAVILFNYGYTLTSDNQGNYSAMWPINASLSAQVPVTLNPNLVSNSNTITGGPFTLGSTNNLPDLVIPCTTTRLTGQIRNCSNQEVPALVVLTGSQLPVAFYCVDGNLDVEVLPLTPLNIVIYAENYTAARSVLTSAGGGNTNVGTLQACQPVKNTIVMNGDGFVNQNFEIDTLNTSTVYYPSGPVTGIIISGTTLPLNKQCLLQIDFCGLHAGNYELGPGGTCNSDVSMILDGVSYFPDDANSADDYITVVEYGGAGGILRGSFFTHLQRNIPTGGTMPITMSGSFIVPRQH